MHILWMLFIGLIVGVIARILMPGKDPGGIIVTTLLGVAGSLLAGLLGSALNIYERGETAGFIASVIGAVLLLFVYRAITRRRHHEVHT